MYFFHKFLYRIAVFCLAAGVLLSQRPSFAKDYDFDLIGSVVSAFDDNINSDPANEKDDFVTHILLGLKFFQELKRCTIQLRADLTQQLFADNTEFNNFAAHFIASLDAEISKYDRMKVKNSFTSAEDVDAVEDEFGRSTSRFHYIRNNFDTTYSRDLSKNAALDLSYGNEVYDTSNDGQADSFENHLGLDYSYTTDSPWVYRGQYKFSARNFDPGGDAYLNHFSGGTRYLFTRQLYLDALAGFSAIKKFSGGGLTKPRFEVSLTNDIDEKTTAKLSYLRESEANTFTEDIFDSWKISAEVNRFLLKRLYGRFSLFYGEGEFDSTQIEEGLFGMRSGLDYILTDDMKAFVSYRLSSKESNTNSREYTRNQISFGFSFDF